MGERNERFVFNHQSVGQTVTTIVEAASAEEAVETFKRHLKQGGGAMTFAFLGRLTLDDLPNGWDNCIESGGEVTSVLVGPDGRKQLLVQADEERPVRPYSGSGDPITCGAALRYVAEEYKAVIGLQRAKSLLVTAKLVESSIGL